MKISQDTLVRQLAESTIIMADMMVMMENYSAYLKGQALKGHNELYARGIEALKENRELVEQHRAEPIPPDPPAKQQSASFCPSCGRSWKLHSGHESCVIESDDLGPGLAKQPRTVEDSIDAPASV